MKGIIKRLFTKALVQYLFNSILSTILDVIVVWYLLYFTFFSLVVSNTIGILLGFVIHYLLSSKKVFNKPFGINGLIIYFATFLLGVGLANMLIYVCYEYIFQLLNNNLRFIFSKGVSIALPFFAIYFLRRHLYRIKY